jgi:hypothetical protein
MMKPPNLISLFLKERNFNFLSSFPSSSLLARQPYVGPGLPQKLLPAKVSGYCFFGFRDKSFFQGGVVSPTPMVLFKEAYFQNIC